MKNLIKKQVDYDVCEAFNDKINNFNMYENLLCVEYIIKIGVNDLVIQNLKTSIKSVLKDYKIN